jgi:S-phase kinase-associated protein 1
MADEATCVLVSSEGESFEVPKSVAVQSELVKEMLEDEDASDIPLPNVKSRVLKLVVEFCHHHYNNEMPKIEKPLRSPNMKDICPEWDANFVDVELDLLFELVMAANYLDIKPLLDLICAKIATYVKGRTPEEIKASFGVTDEFTPEEEEAVRKEYPWLDDL